MTAVAAVTGHVYALAGGALWAGRVGTGRFWRLVPSRADAFAATADTVLGVCGLPPGAGNQVKFAYISRDGGQTWERIADPFIAGYATRAAIGAAGRFVTGSRMALTGMLDGRTWHTIAEGSATAGGFADVMFTDGHHGLAVDVLWQYPLLLTDDGGRHWRPVAVPRR